MAVGWDDKKNAANRRKHGLSFEDASTLFSRDDHLDVFDEEHSDDEDRFIAIGPSKADIVVVVYAEADDETIRIISARHATKREIRMYQTQIGGSFQ